MLDCELHDGRMWPTVSGELIPVPKAGKGLDPASTQQSEHRAAFCSIIAKDDGRLNWFFDWSLGSYRARGSNCTWTPDSQKQWISWPLAFMGSTNLELKICGKKFQRVPKCKTRTLCQVNMSEVTCRYACVASHHFPAQSLQHFFWSTWIRWFCIRCSTSQDGCISMESVRSFVTISKYRSILTYTLLHAIYMLFILHYAL